MLKIVLYFCIILQFFPSKSLAGVQPGIICGYYFNQPKYKYSNPIHAPLCYGTALNFGDDNKLFNFSMQYLRNQSTIEFPLINYTYYRKEITQVGLAGIRCNLLHKTNFHLFIQYNFGGIFAHIQQYANEAVGALKMPNPDFTIKSKFNSAALGYTIHYKSWRIEPGLNLALTRQHNYPYFLNNVFCIRTAYAFSKKSNKN
jgi:hypothetical protein